MFPRSRLASSLLSAVIVTTSVGVVGGCSSDDASASSKKKRKKKRKKKDRKPEVDPGLAAVQAWIGGEVPSGVTLDKSHTGYTTPYEVKYPSPWAKGFARGSSFSAMRRDGAAAVFCAVENPEAWGKGRLTMLAERAPLRSEDIVLQPGVAAKLGPDELEVEAGVGTATIGGQPGGELVWFNARYEEQRYTQKVPFHAFCVLGLRADADEATRTQAQAILRAYRGPKGKKALPAEVGTVGDTGVAAAK